MQRMQRALGTLAPEPYGVRLFQTKYFDGTHMRNADLRESFVALQKII
jgi:hypothetical protein